MITAELGIDSICSTRLFSLSHVSHAQPGTDTRKHSRRPLLDGDSDAQVRGHPGETNLHPHFQGCTPQADTLTTLCGTHCPPPRPRSWRWPLLPCSYPPLTSHPTPCQTPPPEQQAKELHAGLKRALNFSFLNAEMLLSSSFAPNPWVEMDGGVNTVIRKD